MVPGSGIAYPVFYQFDKMIKQRGHIMGAWTGLRVSLESKSRFIDALYPLQGSVKQ